MRSISRARPVPAAERVVSAAAGPFDAQSVRIVYRAMKVKYSVARILHNLQLLIGEVHCNVRFYHCVIRSISSAVPVLGAECVGEEGERPDLRSQM